MTTSQMPPCQTAPSCQLAGLAMEKTGRACDQPRHPASAPGPASGGRPSRRRQISKSSARWKLPCARHHTAPHRGDHWHQRKIDNHRADWPLPDQKLVKLWRLAAILAGRPVRWMIPGQMGSLFWNYHPISWKQRPRCPQISPWYSQHYPGSS